MFADRTSNTTTTKTTHTTTTPTVAMTTSSQERSSTTTTKAAFAVASTTPTSTTTTTTPTTSTTTTTKSTPGQGKEITLHDAIRIKTSSSQDSTVSAVTLLQPSNQNSSLSVSTDVISREVQDATGEDMSMSEFANGVIV